MHEEQNCQRCQRGLPATHIATSEILRVAVCEICVLEALDLPCSRRGDDVVIFPLGPEQDPIPEQP